MTSHLQETFASLLNDVRRDHTAEFIKDYPEFESCPCDWCEEVEKLLGPLKLVNMQTNELDNDSGRA